jgi:hypothetical protein
LFVLLFVGGLAVNEVMTKQALKLQGIQLESIGMGEETKQALQSLNRFVITLVITMVIYLIYSLSVWSFSRYLIWNLVVKGKFVLKKTGKFILANFIWAVIWFIPLIIIMYPMFWLVRTAQVDTIPKFSLFLLGLLSLLILHFTWLYYMGFIKHKKIRDALIYSFKSGTLEIKRFIIPYLFIFLVFVVLSLILFPLKAIPERIYVVISLIFLLVYSGWVRFYLSEV